MKNLVLNVVSGFLSLIVALVPALIVFLLLPASMQADGMVPDELARDALFGWILVLIFALLCFFPVRKCVRWAGQALSSAFKI